jgi:hypothetical protein
MYKIKIIVLIQNKIPQVGEESRQNLCKLQDIMGAFPRKRNKAFLSLILFCQKPTALTHKWIFISNANTTSKKNMIFIYFCEIYLFYFFAFIPVFDPSKVDD